MRRLLLAFGLGLGLALTALRASAQDPTTSAAPPASAAVAPAASASAAAAEASAGATAPPIQTAPLVETAGSTPHRAFATRPVVAGALAMMFLVLGAYVGRADTAGVKSRRGPTSRKH